MAGLALPIAFDRQVVFGEVMRRLERPGAVIMKDY
jgi:hypothetical protein